MKCQAATVFLFAFLCFLCFLGLGSFGFPLFSCPSCPCHSLDLHLPKVQKQFQGLAPQDSQLLTLGSIPSQRSELSPKALQNTTLSRLANHHQKTKTRATGFILIFLLFFIWGWSTHPGRSTPRPTTTRLEQLPWVLIPNRQGWPTSNSLSLSRWHYATWRELGPQILQFPAQLPWFPMFFLKGRTAGFCRLSTRFTQVEEAYIEEPRTATLRLMLFLKLRAFLGLGLSGA